MAAELCPRCGAYWRCNCPPPGIEPYLPDPSCEHDWTPAVGVEVDEAAYPEGGVVMLCRFCGIHAVVAERS
jgi:hypothetical protein